MKKRFLFLCCVLELLVTDNAVPSSLILFALMMQAIHTSKMSVLTRPMWCHIPQDGILHSHHHEKKSNLT
jgi:hypothetical protein